MGIYSNPFLVDREEFSKCIDILSIFFMEKSSFFGNGI